MNDKVQTYALEELVDIDIDAWVEAMGHLNDDPVFHKEALAMADEDTRRELGRIYREEWKPCKDRYYVYVNGGIVSSRSEYRFRYFTNVNDNTIKRARQFTATAAHEFCRDFKQYGPRMVKIAA